MKLEIIKCPSCGASLTVTKEMDIVNCAYCDNAVRVRDSLVIKNDQNIENYLDIAYNAIKVRNFDDAMLYINKVLEIDINNVKAWWGKAVISISDSGGDLIRMREGLTYSLKAYELGNDDEKKEIKEKMISEIIDNKLLFRHTEYLLEIFEAYGADDNRLLLYILDITEECYYNAIANGNDDYIFEYEEMNDKILGLLWKIDKAEYEKTVEQQKTKYAEALDERKIFLNAFKDELFKDSFSKNIFFSIPIIFCLSLAFITPAPKGSAGAVFISMFIVFFLAYLFILNLHIKDKMKIYEKQRYLNNKIF